MAVHFTRVSLYALIAASAFSAIADASEFWGGRWRTAVTLAAVATLVGIGFIFIGQREHPSDAHVRNTRIAAALWGAGFLLLVAGANMGVRAAAPLEALGSAASTAALVTAAWALAGGLARRALAGGLALVVLAYASSAVLVLADGPRVFAMGLPGHALLFTGFYLTLRTLPDPGRAPFGSRRQRGRKARG